MVLSEINFIKQYCTLEQRRHTDNNDAFKIRLYQKYVLVTTEHITISIVLPFLSLKFVSRHPQTKCTKTLISSDMTTELELNCVYHTHYTSQIQSSILKTIISYPLTIIPWPH